ncbi:MAG TPA: type II toxin-antitoxin system VapC family toxin [Thermoanaerobaculia bacterium]|nr:type II toxin-antitoxin system VapC family toxin [Thermoanaerobaculia bacterium]
MYLLDTNACIRILNKTSDALLTRLRHNDPSGICVCSVVKAELVYGAWRSSRLEANLETLRVFFAPLTSIPFDDRSAEYCGRIRAGLSRTGTPIGPYDLMIAAIARAHDLVLVTHNTDEFSRIPDLQLEDWELSAT